MLEVACCWGECVDVLLINNGCSYILYDTLLNKDKWKYGVSRFGSVALTKDEAKILAFDILRSIDECNELDNICKEADDFIEQEKEK